MKRKMRRFNEGGIPDIDREPLRDSSGEIVRSSSGEAVMSGSTPIRARQYQEDIDLGRRMREQRDAEAMDAASLRPTRAPVAEVQPVMTNPRIEARGDTDLAEPSTAGFNRAPIKMPAKPRIQTAVKQPTPKVQVKPPEKMDAKAEPTKRESMLAPRGASVKEITRGMMKRPEGYAKGGKVGTASSRADGIAMRGKTKGKYI